MLTVPEDSTVATAIGKDLWESSVHRFTETLNAIELHLWNNPPGDWYEHPAHLQLLNRFHEFLIETMVREQGWKMLLSTEFVNAVAHIERSSRNCANNSEMYSHGSRKSSLAGVADNIPSTSCGFMMKQFLSCEWR